LAFANICGNVALGSHTVHLSALSTICHKSNCCVSVGVVAVCCVVAVCGGNHL